MRQKSKLAACNTLASIALQGHSSPCSQSVVVEINSRITFVVISTVRGSERDEMNQLFVARMVAVVLTATVISTAVNKYIVEPRVSKPKDK